MALVEPLTIGFHAIDRGRVASDDVVAVLGSGGVGLGAIAAAARRGARVIAVDVDDAKLSLARRAGASDLVNSFASDARSSLLELTRGDGPDVVVEAAGLPETYRLAVDVVAFTGRLVCLGYCAADVPLPARLFVLKELDVVGSRNAAPSDLQSVAAMLAAGVFPREALVSRVVDLEGAGAALAEWSADPAGVTKIHIELSRS
jgi:threonine dehydrogenase-like Zn-dependent dehydrogenase